MSYNFTGTELNKSFTGDVNMLREKTHMAFGNHNSTSNRTQFSYPGPPVDSHLHQQDAPSLSAQHAHTSTHVALHSGSILSNASHTDLLGAQNRAHTSLYEAYIGLKHDIVAKSATITELKAELKALWNQRACLPSESVRERPNNSFDPLRLAPDNVLVTPAALPTLQQSDHEEVRFWKKSDWTSYLERQKKANREPNWHDFITDKKGSPMSRQRHRELWDDAKTAWNSLYFRRLDPQTWSKKHGTAADYFYNTILQKYPEFRLCDGNWKLQTWTTKCYSDWTKNVRGSGGLTRAKPSIIQVGEKRTLNGPERDDKAPKKARVKQEPIKQEKPALLATPIDLEPIVIDDDDDDDMYATDPETAVSQTLSHPSSSKAIDSSTPAKTGGISRNGAQDSIHRIATPLGQAVVSPTPVAKPIQVAPPASTPHASESIASQSLVSTTATATIQPRTPIATISHPQKPLSTVTSPVAPSLPVTPPSLLLSNTTLDSSVTLNISLPPVQSPIISLHGIASSTPTTATGRPMRKKQMNPLANLTVPKPAIDIPKTAAHPAPTNNATKKGKALVPSDKFLTTRNLYMIDYKRENPEHDLDQFNAAFKQLDPKTRQMYDTRSKELKAAKAAGPSLTSAGAAPL